MSANFYGEKYHDLILFEESKGYIKKNNCIEVLDKPIILKKNHKFGG